MLYSEFIDLGGNPAQYFTPGQYCNLIEPFYTFGPFDGPQRHERFIAWFHTHFDALKHVACTQAAHAGRVEDLEAREKAALKLTNENTRTRGDLERRVAAIAEREKRCQEIADRFNTAASTIKRTIEDLYRSR